MECISGDDNDNGDPSINNWLLLGADAMAYAYRLSGDRISSNAQRDYFTQAAVTRGMKGT